MRLRHIALVLLVVAIWALNFTVIKVALREIPPLTLCALRFVLVSIPGILIVKRPAIQVRYIASYGLTMFALQFSLLFSGLHSGTSAGIASLILQVHVVFTFVLAAVFLGEKPSAWKVTGAVVSFAGIGYVAFNLGGDVSGLGLALVVGAAAAWGIGNVISRRLGDVEMLSVIVWSSLFAWPPLLALSFVFEDPIRIVTNARDLSWASIASVVYITYPVTLLAFTIWSRMLALYPVASVAPFTLLVPILAMLIAATILGESVRGWEVVAACLVLSGLCLNAFGERFAIRIRTTFRPAYRGSGK